MSDLCSTGEPFPKIEEPPTTPQMPSNSNPDAPSAVVPAPAKTPNNDLTTNGGRLEFVLKLMEQPLQVGEIRFMIRQPWFDDWRKICEEYPNSSKTPVSRINASTLPGDRFSKAISVPELVWDKLVDW